MRGLTTTMRGAFAEAWANRSGFWTQVLAMVVNDLAWIMFWLLFFHRVGSLRGWDSDRVLLLLAVATTGAGFVLGITANARRIGRMAADGDLDAALALPVPTLAYLLVRRIEPTNLGDVLFGVTLFVVACHPTPSRIALYLFGAAMGAILFAGFLVLVGSLAFFAGRNEAGDLGFQAILMFSAYPVDVFAGAAKVFLYVVLPAAFMASVPAKLIDTFQPALAAAALGIALAFAVSGWALFRAGLRRYTSGAVWTRA